VGTRSSRQLDTALLVAEQLKRPILRMPNKEEVAAMDKLIAEVASPRTKRVLADYKQEGKVCILHVNLTSMPHGLAAALILYMSGLYSHALQSFSQRPCPGCNNILAQPCTVSWMLVSYKLNRCVKPSQRILLP